MKDLDWENLTFGYRKTDYNVRCYYRDGKWGEIEVCSDEYINMHMAATCLHYGQEAFEGLKAYRCPDGKVRIFRVKDNAARLQSTCDGIVMPKVPTEMFEEMVKKVVRLNRHQPAGWRSSVQGLPVPDLRHTCWPVLQGWFCLQQVRHRASVGPLGSTGYRYLQGRR